MDIVEHFEWIFDVGKRILKILKENSNFTSQKEFRCPDMSLYKFILAQYVYLYVQIVTQFLKQRQTL